jgi:uncharacterized protein (TIGR03435 family)
MKLRHLLTLVVATVFLALLQPVARAQSMPILNNGDPKVSSGLKVPQFDVASVKKNKSDSHMMQIMMKADGFRCENISLKTLITNAYGIRQDLISGGPGWTETDGFDIDAKVAGPDVETYKKLTQKERESVLQALLAERFNLKVHRETRTLPIYDLVMAKGGFKLKALAPIDDAAEEAKPKDQRRERGSFSTGPGQFEGKGVDFHNFVDNLAYMVERTVIDKTGLGGIYDIDLKWTPQDESASADSGVEGGPSIFTALQEQLGLKLESGKGPVETIVIDHADLPSEN